MGITPAVRFAAIGLIGLCITGLVWRGVVIYRADQRAQRAAALVREDSGSDSSAVGLGQTAGSMQGAPANAPGGLPVVLPAPVPVKKQLVVHVEGAVLTPGVYTFEEGARVNDAIVAAGGALPEGVPGALNLAALLTDGAKVYVYTRADLQPATPTPPTAQEATYRPVTAAQAKPAAATRTVQVSINTATAAELEAVPGIGPATARAIVEYRTKHGAFRRIEDLTAVSGIGPKTLEKLRPYLQA